MGNIVAKATLKVKHLICLQASSSEYDPSSGKDERFIHEDRSVGNTLRVLVSVEATDLLDEGIDTEDILPGRVVQCSPVEVVEVSWISDINTKFKPVPLDNLIQGSMANVFGEIVTSPATEGKWVTLSIRQEDIVTPVILPEQSHQDLVADFKRLANGGPMMVLITHVVPRQQLGLSKAMTLLGCADSAFELHVDNVNAADLINGTPDRPEEMAEPTKPPSSRLSAAHKVVSLRALSSPYVDNSRASSTVVVDAIITELSFTADSFKYKTGSTTSPLCLGCNQLIITAAVQLSAQAVITSPDYDLMYLKVPVTISTPGFEAIIGKGESESTFANVFKEQADPHEADDAMVHDMFNNAILGRRLLLLVLRSRERNTIIGAEELNTAEGQAPSNAAEAANDFLL